MQHTSRREKREDRLVYLAEQGIFWTKFNLFKSENQRIIRNGFQTEVLVEDQKKAVPTTVSWEHSFTAGAPPVVLSYIEGKTKTFPDVDNFAQKLYVIAARVQHERTQK